MTSQLNVDTIVDKAGSGGTNVKIGNTSTYVSDGGATTQNTVQGLAKVWIHHNQVSSHSIYDSLNVSSLADASTGHTAISFTANMANNDYAGSHHSNGHSAANNFNIGGPGALINRLTDSMDHRSYITSGYIDGILNDNLAFGDLA